MYYRKEHLRNIERLNLDILTGVHFRKEMWDTLKKTDGSLARWDDEEAISSRQTYSHTAAIVLANGACYLGEAAPYYKDVYNHKRGYAVALGKAIVATGKRDPDFFLDTKQTIKDLREQCYQKATELVKDA